MQAADQKEKWVDPYHEKDMEHTHVGQDKLWVMFINISKELLSKLGQY